MQETNQENATKIDVAYVAHLARMYLDESEIETFQSWVVAAAEVASTRERHKIVSFFQGSTRVARNNRTLMRNLRDAGIRYAHEEPGDLITRRQFTRRRAVFIESALSHSGMTHDHNNLRDCLYASCFRRRLDSDWFDDVENERAIDVRPE